MKVQIKAKELVNTKVNRVAMVKRGANQLPFRLTKGEDGVLDMSKLSSAFAPVKKIETKPTVFAAVVRKDVDLEKVKARLTKAGIDCSKQETKDDFILFMQKGVQETDVGLIKLDEDVGLLIANISKAFHGYSFEGTTFEETIKTNGFYPSLRLASECLNDTVYAIMSKAENPSDALSAVQKAVDDFKAYLTTLTANIPEQAFKADMGERLEKGTNPNPNPSPSPTPTPPPKPSPSPKPTKKSDEEKQQGDEDEPPTAPAANAELLDGLKAIMEGAVAGIRKEVETMGADIRKDVHAINQRVATVAEQVKKTEEAVKGTVVADPADDKPDLRKTERSNVRRLPLPPLLDTGTMDLKKEEAAYEADLKKALGR